MNHEQLTTPKGDILYDKNYVFDGAADMLRGTGDSSDALTILATGITLHATIAAADTFMEENKQKTVRVLNVASIRPLDAATILSAALETTHLLVVEDHNVEGGLSSQVADLMADFQVPCSLRRLGLTQFYPSGKAEDLLFFAGLDTESIQNAIEDEIRIEVRGGDDALVTCLYGLVHNARNSRFREQVQPFLDRVHGEQGYLELLREAWSARSAKEEQLPSNDLLRKRLEEAMRDE